MSDQATAFVDAFAVGWRAPHIHAWDDILADDVVLDQPLLPRRRGAEALRDEYGRLLELIPDLRGTVTGWSTEPTDDDEIVAIRMRLDGTLGGAPIGFDLVDVCEIADGRVHRRRAYFDPTALILPLLRRPAAWPAWWRSGLPPLDSRRALLRSQPTSDRRPLALAAGRLALGVAAWIAPRRSARVLGLTSHGDADTTYLLRVYAARAITLGLSTLLAPPGPQRRRAQALGLAVDISDTLAAPASALPPRPRRLSLLLTGTYAAIGALALSRKEVHA